ncbi:MULTISPECIES: FAD-binding oxidoreductase [unclassified Massilia]|uniref:FAD-binding oxidoreductase n=1 Tax=unclassified Massilia TaxID=2609279 RepID=UPI00177B2E2E|nr:MULTISPECIES: FAD-binding protein [unclassified Massilia]MBD8533222.1 FAD-binding oxidoreductase [Massilia sp. CFBP 13647]MBD8672050.1 FAD-binding oxidoreductase [Massilia sp. CFBP 13721]
MKRRDLLGVAMSTALLQGVLPAGAIAKGASRSRARPGTPAWPNAKEWQALRTQTGGRLLALSSPFARGQSEAVRNEALAGLKNPYYIGDHPALTQTSGWQDAWTSRASTYAVAARDAADVAAAVSFARRHNLRLVVKGGGHSYSGASNASDSLLVWTRAMNRVEMIDAFVAQSCPKESAQPAVHVGAGAMWADAYAEVTTRGGRYVQGGGCTTVGVAGLVQGGGFGSFSKGFGTAAASLIEAEVVTADGAIRIANAYTNPDLFWALKGGGGGSFGVVTRLTLRTHALPAFFGAVFGEITASSNDALRALLARFVDFYRASLFNKHWGEAVSLRDGKKLKLSMVFQGLDEAQARATWAPFFAWVRDRKEYSFAEPAVMAIPARHFWDPLFFQKHAPGLTTMDGRPGASPDHHFWTGDGEQGGWFIHGYQSTWLPAALLAPQRQGALVDALCAAAAHWDVELHFNKGLAGAPAAALAATRDTAMNPAVLDAFALAIIAGGGGPAFPGMPGATVDEARARHAAVRIGAGIDALRTAAPDAGTYVSESDYFQARWQDAYWGVNYARLAQVKRAVDPGGLFFVHHGVGSEAWSADGFTRRA